jgi:pyruvate,water dikinase
MKAYHLRQLIDIGIRVPDSYCIPADCLGIIHGLLSDDISITDELTDMIFEMLGIDFERALYTTIANVMQSSPSHSIILRSSASAEDLPSASFAGIYSSRFIGGDAWENHFKSIFVEVLLAPYQQSVKRYIQRRQLHNNFKIALILQEVIAGERSGVLFSCDPISGYPEIVIESTFGLNTILTDGRITPDSYRVDINSGRVKRSRIGNKKIIGRIHDGNYFEFPLSEPDSLKSSLSDGDITSLWLTVKQIEYHFQKPQDVEWTFYDNNLYILQTRPVVLISSANGVV